MLLVRGSVLREGASASLADASARAPRYHPVSRVGSDACGDGVTAEWVPRQLLAPAARGSGDVIILGGSTSRGPVRSPRPGRRLCFATPCLPLRRPPTPGVSFARRRGGAAALNLACRPAVGKPMRRRASRDTRVRGRQSRSRASAWAGHAPLRPLWWPAQNWKIMPARVTRARRPGNAHRGSGARGVQPGGRCHSSPAAGAMRDQRPTAASMRRQRPNQRAIDGRIGARPSPGSMRLRTTAGSRFGRFRRF